MSTSHYSNQNYHSSVAHSRPESTDAGSGTIKLHHRVPLPQNKRRRPYRKLLALLVGGVALLLLDGCAIAEYADTAFEATVFSLLTMPAAGYVISCAFALKHRL